MKKHSKGLIISFDGIDSSGKATHSEELMKRLRAIGKTAHLFSSPDYSTDTGKYLKKLLQDSDAWQRIPWRERMEIFANNRAEHRDEVIKALQQGEYVVYDRYVPSSVAFFTVEALLSNPKDDRVTIQQEIAELEYGAHGMPTEDVSIFLDVPVTVSRALLSKRQKRRADKKEYTDQESVQQKLYNEYDMLCGSNPEHFLRIHCVSGSELLAIPDIAELVWERLLSKFSSLHSTTP